MDTRYNLSLYSDNGQRSEILNITEEGLNKVIELKESGKCLIHKDMHGSVMVVDLSKIVTITADVRHY